MPVPRIKDNDRDMIAAQIDGTDVQTWEYETETERRLCMRLARAFQNGWYACNEYNKDDAEIARLSALVAELTAANTALVVRDEGARRLIEQFRDYGFTDTGCDCDVCAAARAWLAGGVE